MDAEFVGEEQVHITNEGFMTRGMCLTMAEKGKCQREM
jgi:hypothetical protein